MNGVGFALGALASAATALALARVASRVGLADDPSAAPHRKLQDRPVPAIGGPAILVGLLAIECAGGSPVGGAGPWFALVLAFTLGVADDRTRGGLPPIALLLGQAIVATALVASGWRLCAGDPNPALVASLAAVVVALNAVNTFDNADGAATSVGILGLAVGPAALAGPLVGFLPFNLCSAAPARRGVPIAYLGNSGSHLLGVLLVLDPVARFALLVPLLDLARVAFVRLAAGTRPWAGDRRHLAHRMQRAGLAPALVAAILVAIAAPAMITAGAARDGGLVVGLGVLASTLLFALAVRFTPSVD